METFDVLVIGGGQAGLAMGHYLARLGLRFEILEAGPSIGHTWRSRWDSLRLFSPSQYDSLPGMPFPVAADTYPTKEQVADYLQSYAAAFRHPVRRHTRVTSLTSDAAGYLLAAGQETLRARQVVLATGPFQTPLVPALVAGLDPAVTQLHSCLYRNPEQLPEGPALVVGGGNSGFQIALELAATRAVDLSIGTRNITVAQRPLGRDIFWWQTVTGLINVTADSRLGRRMRQADGTIIGVSTRDLRRAGVRLQPRLTAAHGRSVRFADNSRLEVSTVVWATGFRRDYSWIAVPEATNEHGQIVHRRGITPAPGLYVLGLPWQHTTGSALLGFVHRDAAYLADQIASHHQMAPTPPVPPASPDGV